MTQWDFQNKGILTRPARLSFVLKVPLCHLRPSVSYSVPCDRILQRAYYSWIFVLGHYLFLKAHSFPWAMLSENWSLLGTDNVCGEMSKNIFAPNGGYCLFIERGFVISRVNKIKVWLQLITLTKTLIILDITEIESNDCSFIHWMKNKCFLTNGKQYKMHKLWHNYPWPWVSLTGLCLVGYGLSVPMATMGHLHVLFFPK